MCIGTPMQVLSVEGVSGLCRFGERLETIDLSLVPEVKAGDFLLVFLGAARAIIDADYARQVADAHAALAALAHGEAIDFAFADLASREPGLPPHLEAARQRGQASG